VGAILIVDDDQSVGLTFVRMLQAAGHAVTRAESGRDALEQMAENRPDAVILDMRMPEMDGLAFLRLLRADPGYRALPIGIVTGDYFLKEHVLSDLAELGVEIRYKPVWMDDLCELADTLLTSHAPGAS
jgi:CheY-like chemotaxis protein